MTTLFRVLLLTAFVGSVHAAGIVDVARCTIAANDRLPVGAELNKAELACYRANLPRKTADSLYSQRGKPEVHIVVIQGLGPFYNEYGTTPLAQERKRPR